MSIPVELATLVWKWTSSRRLRAGYFAAYCWLVRNRVRVVDIDGIRLKLDFSQMIDVAVYLRRFEPEIVSAIERYARPGYTVVDIGANTGMHALPFAKKVGQDGRVYAFEPTDYAFSRLRENMSLNPHLQVDAFKVALSDENIDSLKIDYRSSWRTDGVVEKHSSVVAVRVFDQWMSEFGGRRIDILKIDVDGNEFPILNGAKRTLEMDRPLIFIEIGPWHFQSAERNPLTLLSGIGYRFWDAKSMTETSRTALEAYFRGLSEETTINVIASTDVNFSN
jgi:FkbM family methyltransferase